MTIPPTPNGLYSATATIALTISETPPIAVGSHGRCSEKNVRVSSRFAPANGRLKENQNSASATSRVESGPNSPRS
jgi:hypothetical protein